MTRLAIDGIDLSDIEFWAKPEAEREAAFQRLRDEAPITFYDEVLIEGFPQGPGYWALTRYADVVHVSRHPELFVSVSATTRPKRAGSAAWKAPTVLVMLTTPSC